MMRSRLPLGSKTRILPVRKTRARFRFVTTQQSAAGIRGDDGRRFVVRADEKLTAFLELQAAIHRRFE